eukprot:TRINITY_DN2231_c0_g1_i1.p1 TRINITY_DN2231_c0_g1~~TRINITY_DN2231_c0_g1_i1.p1  ORF type:complete len:291 (-),score=77.43 TRINITY_DN2231_c0_g1_i1:308-1180(-)
MALNFAPLEALFDRIDQLVSKDGVASKDELALVFGEHAEEFLKFCDADGDTKLTKEEFIAGIKGDTEGMTDEDFKTNWVDRMESVVKQAEDRPAPEEAEEELDPICGPEDVLTYWWSGTEEEQKVRHWYGRKETDDEIRRKFFNTWTALSGDGSELADEWAAGEVRSISALILVWDQFSRVLWRGDGRSFSQDHKSGALSMKTIKATPDLDAVMSKGEQTFLKMPLMHSEDKEVQEYSLSLSPESDHAVGHHACIVRFGRFPKRNDALGRECTPEELEYMASDEAQGRPY